MTVALRLNDDQREGLPGACLTVDDGRVETRCQTPLSFVVTDGQTAQTGVRPDGRHDGAARRWLSVRHDEEAVVLRSPDADCHHRLYGIKTV